GAVPRVDDARIDPTAFGEHARGAGRTVAQDDRNRPHGREGLRRALEALAPRTARSFRAEVDDLARKPLRRALEAHAYAGRILEEQVDDRAAAQRRELLDLAVGDTRHVLGDVEQPDGVVAAQVQGREQVPHSSIVTSSVPSMSASRT